MAADSQVRLFHQLCQVLSRGAGEVDEFHVAAGELGQPAAQWVGTRLRLEVAPRLPGLAVVRVVHVVQQAFDGLSLWQVVGCEVQNGRAAVRLLVDLMDHGAANWHWCFSSVCAAFCGRWRL
ncbi:hypothetical protein D3C77_633670 [compost metagenome]